MSWHLASNGVCCDTVSNSPDPEPEYPDERSMSLDETSLTGTIITSVLAVLMDLTQLTRSLYIKYSINSRSRMTRDEHTVATSTPDELDIGVLTTSATNRHDTHQHTHTDLDTIRINRYRHDTHQHTHTDLDTTRINRYRYDTHQHTHTDLDTIRINRYRHDTHQHTHTDLDMTRINTRTQI